MKNKILDYLYKNMYYDLNKFIMYFFIKDKCIITIKNYFNIKYNNGELIIYVNENMNIEKIINYIFIYLQNNKSKIVFIKNKFNEIQNLFLIENKQMQLDIPIIDIINLQIYDNNKMELLNKDTLFLNKHKLKKKDINKKLLIYNNIEFFINLYKMNPNYIKANNKFFIYLLKNCNIDTKSVYNNILSINFLKNINNKIFLNIYFDNVINELDDIFFKSINDSNDINLQYSNIKLLKKEIIQKILINVNFKTKVELTNLINKG